MDKVKRIRKEIGLKQKDLAIEMGMQLSNYSNIENGRYIPDNIGGVKDKAINILMPLLQEKIKSVKADLERLENLTLIKYK